MQGDIKNFDRLEALILLAGDTLIEEDVEYAENLPDHFDGLSEKTERKIRRRIIANRRKKEHPMSLWMSGLRRAAVIVLVVCSTLFALTVAIEPIRAALFGAVMEMFDEYVDVRWDDGEWRNSKKLTEVKEPSYIPKGYEVSEVYRSDYVNRVYYIKDGTEALCISQDTLIHDNTLYDNRNAEFSYIEVNGYTALLIQYNDDIVTYTLTWKDETYKYAIMTYDIELNLDEVIKIAE
ncbi:MAG: DUF4367 domain-containing protein, partial [Clostridia bacterium]|nr:DUF4367 domain-containing protein [Clostridia bacterium]